LADVWYTGTGKSSPDLKEFSFMAYREMERHCDRKFLVGPAILSFVIRSYNCEY
jgi:hypothetical protein